MKCKFCKSKDCHVIDTRWIESVRITRRRYQCNACGERFNTREAYYKFRMGPAKIKRKPVKKQKFDKGARKNLLIERHRRLVALRKEKSNDI